jgi:hypothetical protein
MWNLSNGFGSMQTLPKGSPLNVVAPSHSEDSPEMQLHRLDEEDGDGVPYRSTMPRPSEQWEDSIAGDEENSQGTLSSQCTVSNNGTVGKFGIGNSRCVYFICRLKYEVSDTSLLLFYSYNPKLV